MGLFSRKDKPPPPAQPQPHSHTHSTNNRPSPQQQQYTQPPPSHSPYNSPPPSEGPRRAFGPRAPRDRSSAQGGAYDARLGERAGSATAGDPRGAHARGGSVDQQLTSRLQDMRLGQGSRERGHEKSASLGAVARAQPQGSPLRGSVSPQQVQQGSMNGPRLPGQKSSVNNLRAAAAGAGARPPLPPQGTRPPPPPQLSTGAPQLHQQQQQQQRHSVTQPPTSGSLAQQLARASQRPLPPSSSGGSSHPSQSQSASSSSFASRYTAQTSQTTSSSTSSAYSKAPTASWTTEGAPPRIKNHPHPHSYAPDAPKLKPFAQVLQTPRVPGQPMVLQEQLKEREPTPFGQVVQTPFAPQGFDHSHADQQQQQPQQRYEQAPPLPPMPPQAHPPPPVQGRRLVSEGSAGGLPGAFAPSWNPEPPLPSQAANSQEAPPHSLSQSVGAGGGGGGLGQETPWMNAHRPPPRNQMPYFAATQPPQQAPPQPPLPPARPPLPHPLSAPGLAQHPTQTRPAPPSRPATFGLPPSATGQSMTRKPPPAIGILRPTVPSPSNTPPRTAAQPQSKTKAGPTAGAGAGAKGGGSKGRKASGASSKKLAYLLSETDSDYSSEGSIKFIDDDSDTEEEGDENTAVAKLIARSARSNQTSTPPRGRVKGTPTKSKATAKVSPRAGKASPAAVRHQCSGTTASGKRCTRLAVDSSGTGTGTPTKGGSPVPSDTLDTMILHASEGGAESGSVVRFCFQHTSHALSESGCFVRRGATGESIWVEYDDWILGDLPQQTQVALRDGMSAPVSARDEEGYIYVHELVDKRRAGAGGGGGTTYLKLGRSIHPVSRLSQWRSQCPSREPIVRDILPRAVSHSLKTASSLPRGTLSFAERGLPNHHRWERLVLIEVAGRAAQELGQEEGGVKGGRRECADCGAKHQELFEVREGAWEEWVREVVERWGRWVGEVLG